MTLPRSDVSDPNASRLDYAPTPKPGGWRMIRRAMLLILLVGLPVLAVRRGPSIARKANFLYHQHGCLRYNATPDEVVFDSDPVRVAALAGDPNFVIVGGCAFRKPPSDWAAFSSSLGVGNYVSFTPPRGLSVLFLHEREVNGVRYLIMVERTFGAGQSPYFIPGYDIETCTIDPATLRFPARKIPFGFTFDVKDGGGPHTNIRIYAGQIDPADDSRFTIRFEFRGKSGVVEGRVGSDGHVDFHRDEDR
jgi:hypothetical protein